ncbi:DUF1365 domain-containing protein [Thalassospira marina]|uniref:DUF1365 domain-containing protein n=1 Tax=Thalassospira marina TaxID=2048283 RepID=A0ABM6Q4W1_9PROT|nr:DUF1365 family protein [Thalassospira marina]AUG51527.1 DUF1365 domain-containing protein [Thalassospira marina]
MAQLGAEKRASALYQGVVTHHRLRPRQHRLRYRVVSFLFDLDEIGQLHRKLRFFSHNRFNLFSFHDRDFGRGDGKGLRAQIMEMLQQNGLADCGARIEILCYPRILGFVFNPLSVYFCYRENGELGAILHDVSNTFGDRHGYLIPVTDACHDAKGVVHQTCAKQFHVSPFIGMKADYRFRICPPGDRVAIAIAESDDEGVFLNAAFAGNHTVLTDRTLLSAFLRYPLMTLKVIAGIHWEAVHLWRKGFAFHRRPTPPEHRITYVAASGAALLSTTRKGNHHA